MENSIGGGVHTIHRSETGGGVGPNRDRGSATTVFSAHICTPYMSFKFTFTYLGNQLPQSPFSKTLLGFFWVVVSVSE